jgi:hypothetical protein
LQFLEGSWPDQEFANNEERPSISDVIQRPGESAELAIALAGFHAKILLSI